MDNKEMEKKELNPEELNQVAGGKPVIVDPVKVWVCEDCKATFTSFLDFSKHMEIRHYKVPLL